MDWDNLRFFLELARAGTLVGAARRLAVDHTTVARRLQALEKQVGAALFAREAGGHRLTEAGRALLPQVEAMEAAFLAVENAAPGVRQGLHGLVRIGTTEGFGNLILAPQLARFALSHPGLVVDLLALPRLVHLSRREADIVISLERPARGAVIVVKLTDYVLQLYAAVATGVGNFFDRSVSDVLWSPPSCRSFCWQCAVNASPDANTFLVCSSSRLA